MPTEEELSSYIKNVNADKLNNLIGNLKQIELENFEEGYVTKITGYIPEFKYQYNLDLKGDLQSLGVIDVIDYDNSNLNKITKNKSYIQKAIHNANVDFSNEGIKASAVSIFTSYSESILITFDYLYDVPVKEIDLTFNKPFIYLIRDKDTGEV